MLFIVNRWNVADRILYSWMLCVCSGCCWLVILYLSVYPSLLFYVSILPWNRNTVYIECGVITAPRPKQLHSYALIVPICGTNIIGNIRFRIRLCERLWHAYCCCYLCYSCASARQYMTINGLSKWNFPSTFLAVICWLLLLSRRYMYAPWIRFYLPRYNLLHLLHLIHQNSWFTNQMPEFSFNFDVYSKGCSPHFLFIFLYSFLLFIS